MANPNNCATCDHKRHPDGGHCYMFREEPQEICNVHTARTRLLQDETQTYDSKGLSRWLSSRPNARQEARNVAAEVAEERDLAHEADMEKLRREQLRADISPEEAAEECAEIEARAAWMEGADLDDGSDLMGDPDEYDYDEDETVCERCHGDGRDPWNDYLLPCPECQGEQP